MWAPARQKERPICQYFLPPDETSHGAETETGAALSQPLSDAAPFEPPLNLESHADAFDAADQAIDAMMNRQDLAQQADSLDELVERLEAGHQVPEQVEQDPYQLMNQAFDQAMQMMDPFNMMGPLG